MSATELPTLSCIFAPSLATASHIALAESLGYSRAWCYDSPALYADPWMVLALAAERTSTIGLGPASLVPSLRHPLVNAAAMSTLAGLAPGRVSAAFGTGLTGRMLLGERPMPWADVADYVRTVRALLRGEDTVWNGQVLRMLQPPDFGASRPIDAAVLIAADGPRGTAIADALADGLFSARVPRSADDRRRILLTLGTVLEEGEQTADARVVAAAGPGLAAAYHAIYEARGPDGVKDLPGGAEWAAAIEAIEEGQRHFAVHQGHLVQTNASDDVFLPSAVHLLGKWTTTDTRRAVHARLGRLAAQGVTEIAYQPMGPDIPRELSAFAEAAAK